MLGGEQICVIHFSSAITLLLLKGRIQHKDRKSLIQPAREALGLLLADGTPTGGRGEDFLNRQPDFFTETAVTPERKVEKWFPRWEINRHGEG